MPRMRLAAGEARNGKEEMKSGTVCFSGVSTAPPGAEENP